MEDVASVKSGDRTIAKNGYVFVGDGLTINWDGSYGVDNFKLVVTLNGSEIYNKTFNHDGPGTVTISADKISAMHLMMVVLPVPGPPVITVTPLISAERTAPS